MKSASSKLQAAFLPESEGPLLVLAEDLDLATKMSSFLVAASLSSMVMFPSLRTLVKKVAKDNEVFSSPSKK